MSEQNGKDVTTPPVEDRPVLGTCINCKFSSLQLSDATPVMTCKRNAPTFLGTAIGLQRETPQGKVLSPHWFTAQGWPNVSQNDWCGQYEAAPRRERSLAANDSVIAQPS